MYPPEVSCCPQVLLSPDLFLKCGLLASPASEAQGRRSGCDETRQAHRAFEKIGLMTQAEVDLLVRCQT